MRSFRNTKAIWLVIFWVCFSVGTISAQQSAGGVNFPFVDLSVRDSESNEEVVLSIQLLLLLGILSLAPSFVILMTSFLRIAIVFDFVKRALSLQQVPPNQVLMGIALFLTFNVKITLFKAVLSDLEIPRTN